MFFWGATALAFFGLVLGSLFERADVSEWTVDPKGSPTQLAKGRSKSDEVEVLFFGTSTLLFRDAETSWMVDGFFTRPSLFTVLGGQLQSDIDVVSRSMKAGGVVDVRSLFVSHSHYDHILDVANLHRLFGMEVHGTETTHWLLKSTDPSMNSTRLKSGVAVDVGAFQIEPHLTPHSLPLRYPGHLEGLTDPPESVSDYVEGGNHSFVVKHPAGDFAIIPSANFKTGALPKTEVETLFLSVGGLNVENQSFLMDYWQNTVTHLSVNDVVLIHWDDFFRSLEKPLLPFPETFSEFKALWKTLALLAEGSGVRLCLLRAKTVYRVKSICKEG